MSTSTKEKSTLKFDLYPSVKKLKELAKNPFDLTKEGNLSPERLNHFTGESAGYKMLYGTERIDDNTMKALQDLAKEAQALEKMNHMQSGEITNFIRGFPSDNRSVLHTALRDFWDNPQTAKAAKEAADLARKECDKLKAFIAKIDKENHFTDLIMVAIGGSDLGPRAHYVALQHLQKPGRHVYFISNVDPDDAAAVLRQADLKKSLVVCVSKSGETLETQTNEEFLRDRFAKAGLKPEEHFIAVTSFGSPMDNPKRYLATFHMWDWVGGRFSTTSMVGGVVLSFAFGFDVYWEMLHGANAMDKAALNPELKNNLPLLGALLGIWNRNFLHHPILAMVPYSQGLLRYAAHIQQVDMESNGKRIDHDGNAVDFDTGPIVFGEPGTNAQHSYYQLIHQGTTVVPLEFVGYRLSQYQNDFDWKGTNSQEKLLSNLFAQAIALAQGKNDDNPNKVFPGNRPSHILLGKQLTPFSLGALLSYFENKIAFQGFVWDINSFDQEGVQLGKILANKIIDRFAASKNSKGKHQEYPLGDAYLKHLETVK